ncbi:flippase [Fructobacillus evanidus]|uniref:flippase n=1 Tax=Fructobacillus evanidus TaxID=3064281 RepID=UPI002DA7AFB3|nr:Membrane protein involved in the export of O-antigen and teichoic acid (RfbX) [Fructobacillus sp. LMG 32999]
MKVIKNYLYNMGYQVLLIIVPLVTMPYISRVLGPHGLGVYAYTNSIISYFVLLANLGIDAYGSRQIAYVREDFEKRSQVFWEITILKVFTTAVACLLLLLYLPFAGNLRVLMVAQALSLIAVMFDMSWYFVGIEDFQKSVTRNVLIKLASLVLIFIFVRHATDTLIYIIITSGSSLAGNAALVPFLKKEVKRIPFGQLNVQKHFLPALLLFVPQIGMQLYLVANKTILGMMDTVTAVGFFSSADSIVRLGMTMVSAISTALSPRISHLIAEKKVSSVERYMQEAFEIINAVAIPLALGLMIVTTKFVPIFFGPGYGMVAKLMIIESPAIMITSWSVAITSQYLILADMTREYMWSTVIGALSNIIFNYFLILNFGVYGTVYATLLSEGLVVSYLMFCIRKQLHIRQVFFFEFYKLIIAGLLMAGIVYCLDLWLPTTILAIVIEVVVGVLSYALLLWLFRANVIINIRTFFQG